MVRGTLWKITEIFQRVFPLTIFRHPWQRFVQVYLKERSICAICAIFTFYGYRANRANGNFSDFPKGPPLPFFRIFLKIGITDPRGGTTPMAKICAGLFEGKIHLRSICAICAFQVDPLLFTSESWVMYSHCLSPSAEGVEAEANSLIKLVDGRQASWGLGSIAKHHVKSMTGRIRWAVLLIPVRQVNKVIQFKFSPV